MYMNVEHKTVWNQRRHKSLYERSLEMTFMERLNFEKDSKSIRSAGNYRPICYTRD